MWHRRLSLQQLLEGYEGEGVVFECYGLEALGAAQASANEMKVCSDIRFRKIFRLVI